MVQLDQKTITDGPASEEEEETYTDARIRKAPLPGLAIGAIVEEETVLEDKSPFFTGGGCLSRFLFAQCAGCSLRVGGGRGQGTRSCNTARICFPIS